MYKAILLFVLSLAFVNCSSDSNTSGSDNRNSIETTETEEVDTTTSSINEEAIKEETAFEDTAIDPADFPSYEEEQIAKIMLPGTFHEDEVWEGVADENWFGLYKTDGSYTVRSVEISTKRIHDEMTDPEGINTGWEISVDDELNCLILVAGIETISEGPVTSVPIKKQQINPKEEETFDLGSSKYRLYATGLTKKEENYAMVLVKNYKLYISTEPEGKQVEQLLVAKSGFDDEMIDIVWIGDMDGDGLPDLIINTSRHYNSSVMSLYLSSEAGKGQIVKYVGSHWSVGC